MTIKVFGDRPMCFRNTDFTKFLKNHGVETKFKTFEEIKGNSPEECALIMLAIGIKGDLTNEKAQDAVQAYENLLRMYSISKIVICLPGYDPYSKLWEDRRLRSFVKLWTSAIGGDDEILKMHRSNKWMLNCLTYEGNKDEK